MEEPTPLLDPNELYNKRRSKDAARLKAYNKILEQIYNRIRVISRLPNSQCYLLYTCLLYTSPSPRDRQKSRMPSSA